jgi:hypothetical protein
MDFAVYQHDIQHIIVDNLQFMMPRSISSNVRASGFEKVTLFVFCILYSVCRVLYGVLYRDGNYESCPPNPNPHPNLSP